MPVELDRTNDDIRLIMKWVHIGTYTQPFSLSIIGSRHGNPHFSCDVYA